jgi:hypothetical protein
MDTSGVCFDTKRNCFGTLDNALHLVTAFSPHVREIEKDHMCARMLMENVADHVVYVDDNLECRLDVVNDSKITHLQDVVYTTAQVANLRKCHSKIHFVRIPLEGGGIDQCAMSHIDEILFRIRPPRSKITLVLDFDHTLTTHHLYKTACNTLVSRFGQYRQKLRRYMTNVHTRCAIGCLD